MITTPQILYEDNQVIVAVKPQNMPSQSDISGDDSFQEILREYVRVKYMKPGAAWLGLVHRLDRPAGGVMVFARTSKAASRLSDQIRNGLFEKTYLAVTGGSLPQAGTLEDWLIKNRETNTSRNAAPGEPGARLARLSYVTAGKEDGFTLLRVKLETGRPHQIRIQMKIAGAPLAGDRRYGGEPAPELCLWASQLRFKHPTRPEMIHAFCPPPQLFPWTLFRLPTVSTTDIEALEP